MTDIGPERRLGRALDRIVGGPISPLVVRSSWSVAIAAVTLAFLLGLSLLAHAAGVVALLGLALGLGLVRLAPHDRSFLLLLFLAGFGLRLIVAVLVYHVAPLFGVSRFVWPDSWAYDWMAARIVDSWAGVPIPNYVYYDYLVTAYTRMIAVVYWALGPSPVAALVLNCGLAAAAAVLIAVATSRLFDERVARVAGIAASFFPSPLFWSVLLLKDAFYTFLVAVCIWAIMELITSRRPLWLVPLALAWWSLADVRNFAFYFLGVLIPIAFFLGVAQPLRLRLALSGILVLVVVPVMLHYGAERMVRYYLLGDTAAVFEYHRMANAMSADSAFVPALPPASATSTPQSEGLEPTTLGQATADAVSAVADVVGASPTVFAAPTVVPFSDPGGNLFQPDAEQEQLPSRGSGLSRLLEYLPVGLWYTLTAPLPWNTPKLSQKLTIPDMLLWYVLAATALVGLVVAWPRWRLFVLPVGYLVSIAILLAMLEGNVGTLFRHRAMLIPFTTIFSARGAVWLWDHCVVRYSVRVRALGEPRSTT
jgi:hypothetical protein